MRYLGGKMRQAKKIVAVVAAVAEQHGKTVWVEPFVGGASVLAAAGERFGLRYGSDLDANLITFWRKVRDGWVPPATMSREQYNGLRDGSIEYAPPEIRTWAKYACSLNGKPWAGYAAVEPNGRDRLAESVRSTIAKGRLLAGAYLHECTYDRVTLLPEAIVYADPPYAGTTGYGGSFDSEAFWAWCSKLAVAGVPVIVSEYSAPPDFIPLVSWQRTATLDATKTKVRTESLYLHESFCQGVVLP